MSDGLRCITVDVDGEPVVFRVSVDPTPEDIEAMRDLARAAREQITRRED